MLCAFQLQLLDYHSRKEQYMVLIVSCPLFVLPSDYSDFTFCFNQMCKMEKEAWVQVPALELTR